MQENKIEDIAVKTASEFAGSIGIGSVVAQIYAILYVSQEAISLDEISEKLKLSKSSISQNIRILESWDAVKRIFVKGSRKDFYEANQDIMGIILKRLKSGLNNRLDRASASLKEIEQHMTLPEDKTKGAFYLQRLENLKKIHQTVSTLINMLPDKM